MLVCDFNIQVEQPRDLVRDSGQHKLRYSTQTEMKASIAHGVMLHLGCFNFQSEALAEKL